jgi:hypothetical protein
MLGKKENVKKNQNFLQSRPEYKESLRSGTLLTRQTLQPRIGKRMKDSKEEQRRRLYLKFIEKKD